MWRKTIFIMLLFVVGCSAYMASLQSSFFSKFSLRDLVERNESTAMSVLPFPLKATKIPAVPEPLCVIRAHQCKSAYTDLGG